MTMTRREALTNARDLAYVTIGKLTTEGVCPMDTLNAALDAVIKAEQALRWLCNPGDDPEQYTPDGAVNGGKMEKTEEPAPVTVEKVPEEPKESVEKAEPPVDIPRQEETAPQEEHYPELADVRARLADYRTTGVDVAALLSALGCKRLSDVPAARYTELLEMAAQAAKGA